MNISAPPPRIVDAVFGRRVGRARGRRVLAFVAAIAIYAGGGLGVAWWDPSLEAWAAAIAAHVHAEIDRTQPVAVEMPPPPPLPPPKVEPPPPPKAPPAIAPAPRTSAPSSHAPPSPAAAAKVVATDPTAPADFSGDSIVTGDAKRYAGGSTASNGKSDKAVTGPVDAKGPPAASRAQAVSLADDEWSCRWPAEAESSDVEEQAVVLKVRVGSDGIVREVKVVDDPGNGFGAAATRCAQKTHFQPALNDAGAAITAWSPPIRVRFTR